MTLSNKTWGILRIYKGIAILPSHMFHVERQNNIYFFGHQYGGKEWGADLVKSGLDGRHFWSIVWPLYPLVNQQLAIEHGLLIDSWFSYEWWFSQAMLVYQRVPNKHDGVHYVDYVLGIFHEYI